MAAFQGMRWFKCDFQVQTPEDAANWADAETRLGEPRRPLVAPPPAPDGSVGPNVASESRIQAVARTFLQRCHALELEVIGVTDHNFSQKTEPRDWFLTHLVDQNKSVARELGRPALHIMPGFEVDIGFHVLCLFNPAKRLDHLKRVNMILTKLGLGEVHRFRAGQPEPLRLAGEGVSLKRVLEVVQGEHDGIVIAAHADQHDGILSQPRNIPDYQNLELLAVEVTANPPARPYFDILAGRNPQWSRPIRQPAFVMSSDAKSLAVDKDRRPVPNSLGYRHTWLKMSNPSTEALRQAFLDPDSRITVMGARPSDTQTHPRIRRLEVRGAKFLADQEVILSENLNCVIGGRGSGKSSLVEYLRFALQADESVPPTEDSTLSRKRAQLKATLSDPAAEFRVEFQSSNGVSDTLVYAPASPTQTVHRIEGRQVEDLPTVVKQLHAQFFSQGELSRMTGDSKGQGQVLALVDASSGPALQELKGAERELVARSRALFQAKNDEVRLSAEVKVLNQEAVEIERQLKANAVVQGEAAKNQLALRARRFLDDMVEMGAQEIQSLRSAEAAAALPSLLLPEDASDWPEAVWFVEATKDLNAAKQTLREDLVAAAEQYAVKVDATTSPQATMGVRASIQKLQDAFVAACQAQGIKPEDIAKLQQLEDALLAKGHQLAKRQKELADTKERANQVPVLLQELHQVWQAQFDLRRRTAEQMQAAVASQTLRIAIAYMDDRDSFRRIWQRLTPKDGRGKLARHWDELGEDLFAAWKQRAMEPSPWETLEAGRQDPRAIPWLHGELGEDLQPALLRHVDSVDVRPVWESIRVARVDDLIDVELLRDDGSVAGSMAGALSEGQRNTVLLNLMLARGSGPIIIDQPEDELDSSFIYKTLVADLRHAKLKRQLIVATHNANLPVNGDAELIYALEARGGRGYPIAQGGLDQDCVARAVLEVMEGSEEAFRRRSEKYNF